VSPIWSSRLHGSWQLSGEPSKLRSIGAHSELTVWDTGENVVARSLVSCGVRHFDDSCGGPITPPVWVRVVTCHRPGSSPSAKAVEPLDHATAISPHRMVDQKGR